MFKIFFIAIIMCFGFAEYSIAQTLVITFEKQNNLTNNGAMSNIVGYEVILNAHKSICTTGKIKLNHDYLELDENIEKDDHRIRKLSDDNFLFDNKNSTYYFKDYLTDSLIYHAPIFTKNHEVGERLSDRYDWEITDKDTTYLGYNCKIAISEFRGQKWTALFTDEFGLNGGPWKFDGLPGLILSVYNTDRTHVFNAIQLELLKETKEIVNPFQNLKLLTWDEYTKLHKKKFKNQLRQIKAKSSDGSAGKIVIGNQIEDLGYREISIK